MATARKYQINLDVTRHYHCISRCVRRAFLCGYDAKTNISFDHRKQWLVDLMHQLTDVFAIRVCAYAVMSNHYHLVLYVDQELALSWSKHEVIERWARLFPMSKAKIWLDFFVDLEKLTEDQEIQLDQWRQQLHDISWFMRKLNEYIARRANKEDNCTGRFWEERFKSQALLDESALLACMAYVDLNPIRAGLSQTPEDSEFTSIRERINAFKAKTSEVSTLCGFEREADQKSKEHRLPITQADYFELVDTTGRLIRHGKRGAIPDSLSPILERLQIKSSSWVDTIATLSQSFATFMGRPESIESCMIVLERPRMIGLKQALSVFK